MKNKEFYSITELAKLLSISRVAVFKRIKAGKIKAIRVGRVYAIPREEFEVFSGEKLSENQKLVIKEGVRRTIKEYGQTLKMLGAK